MIFMKTVMYFVLYFLLACILSSCESYHIFCASQSLGPEQNEHLRALAELTEREKAERKPIYYTCESYPAGMGGFSSSCRIIE